MKLSLHWWAMLVTASLLVPPAYAAHEAVSATSWRPPTNNALEFEIREGTLASFDGGTLSVRRQRGEHAVWRLGCEFSALHSRIRRSESYPHAEPRLYSGGHDDFTVTAQLTRLTFPWPERRLRPWAGIAFGGGLSRLGWESQENGFAFSTASRVPQAYGVALAGLEYSIAPRFALHAQYGQGAQYSVRHSQGVLSYGIRETSSGPTTSWQLYTTGARFGLAVFY